jgi:HEAT repeats
MATLTCRLVAIACIAFPVGSMPMQLPSLPQASNTKPDEKVEPPQPAPSADEINQRKLLDEALRLVGPHCVSDPDEVAATMRKLMLRRDALRPAFEAILANPKSHPTKVSSTFYTLVLTATTGQRFIELAVERLADNTSGVRAGALYYLEHYGSALDTAPIVALLSDSDIIVHHAAAKTLAKIGGPRDIVAMDAWLKSGTAHRKDGDFQRHVKECRDALEKRLKAIPKDLQH